jgi:hypothetical protein
LRLPKRVIVNCECTIQLPQHKKIALKLLLARLRCNTRLLDVLAVANTHSDISINLSLSALLLFPLLPRIFFLLQRAQHAQITQLFERHRCTKT